MTNDIDVPTPTNIPITMNNPTVTSYGFQDLTGTLNFNWPFDSTASGIETKLAVYIKGGYSATWTDIEELKFFDLTNALLLWANRKLNKIILSILPHTATPYVLQVSGLNNPYPFHE